MRCGGSEVKSVACESWGVGRTSFDSNGATLSTDLMPPCPLPLSSHTPSPPQLMLWAQEMASKGLISVALENVALNRYSNILPYNRCLVQVCFPPEPPVCATANLHPAVVLTYSSSALAGLSCNGPFTDQRLSTPATSLCPTAVSSP